MSPPRPSDPDPLLQHAGFLRRLARSLLGPGQGADDAVQDTLVAALRRPAGVRNLRAWLTRVLRNFARMERRGAARRRRREEAAARPEGLPSAAEIAERLDAEALVVEAVRALPEPFRTTIVLRYHEDLPVAEIARREEVTPRAVRARLQRALALLRFRLDEHHGGSRAAWSALLVPLEFGTPAAAAGSGLAGAAALGGVVKAKTIALAALVAAAVSVYFLAGLDAPDPGPGRAGGDRETRAAAPPPDKTSGESSEPRADDPETARAAAPLDIVCLHVETRAPLAGIEVELRGTNRRARTDADGRARFADRPAGDARVRIARPGFVLVDRRVPTGRDELTLLLQPGLAVRGRVVHSATGAPVAGASLTARHVSVADIRRVAHGLVTDDEGRFVVPAVIPGRPFEIVVAPPGWTPARVEAVRHAGNADNELVVRLVRGATVTGVLLAADGRPVANAPVWLIPAAGPDVLPVDPRVDEREVQPRPTRTAADGRFLWAGVTEPRHYVLFACGPAWNEVARAHLLVDAAPVRRDLRLERLGHLELRVRDVAGTPVTDALVILRPPEALGPQRHRGEAGAEGVYRILLNGAGRFSFEVASAHHLRHEGIFTAGAGEVVRREVRLDPGAVLAGRVVDDRGAPVRHAIVRLLGAVNRGTRTNEDGAFGLPGLAAGEAVLHVRGELTHWTTERRIVLPHAGPLDLVLPRAPRVRGTPHPAPPHGRVQVTWHGAAGGSSARWVSLDDDGAFEVVQPEFARGGVFEVTWPGVAPVRFVNVELPPGERRDLGRVDAARGPALEGVVRDEAGRPVPGAHVQLMVGFRPSRLDGLTDRAGRFRIENVPDEELLVLVEAAGYAAGRIRARPGDAPVEVRLAATGRVRIVVRDARGTPVPGAKISYEPVIEGPGSIRVTSAGVTEADGTRELELRPGRWRFTARRDGRTVRGEPVEVRAGETAASELFLR